MLKQGKFEAAEVLTGGGDSDVKDLNSLCLIQKLYQLSGEAKVSIKRAINSHPDIIKMFCLFLLKHVHILTLVLLNPDRSCRSRSVDF